TTFTWSGQMGSRIRAWCASFMLVACASAQPCTPGFDPAMEGTGLGSTAGQVYDMVVFDDGLGPRLIAGGSFQFAGTQPAMNIARATQALGWEPMGEGLQGTVKALEVFNDGTGLKLYAGGNFATGTEADAGVRRWNGQSWERLGGPDGSVTDLVVWNDGNGAALYACGSFTTAGGQPCSGLAKWNGLGWSRLGDGILGKINGMSVWDSPTGSKLAVVGIFSRAGTINASSMALWTGTTWETFAAITQFGEIFSVGQFIKPGVRELWYSTTDFTAPLRKWNGTTVQTVSVSFIGSRTISSIRPIVENNETSLLLTGNFLTSTASNAMRWNGISFFALSTPSASTTGQVYCAAQHRFTGDASPRLILGGIFSVYFRTGAPAGYCGPVLTILPGRTSVAAMNDILTVPGGRAVAVGGNPRTLYAAGAFGSAPQTAGLPQYLAAWSPDLNAWQRVTNGPLGAVAAILEADNDELLLAGSFTASATNQSVQYVGLFDGTSMRSMPGPGIGSNGLPYPVLALTAGKEAGATTYYAATTNSSALIYRWNGLSWNEVTTLRNSNVFGMGHFDMGDGSGASLYAAGSISITGTSSFVPVGRATATGFAALGTELRTGFGYDIDAFDLGNGKAIYACGQLGISPPGSPTAITFWPVAVLDNGQWKSVGNNLTGTARSMAVWDDGSGPALYAAGDLEVGGVSSGSGFARFNGQAWELVDGSFNGTVHALAIDPQNDRVLHAAGDFSRVGGFAGPLQSSVATVRGCARCPADWNRDGGINLSDVDDFFAVWEQGDQHADLNEDGGVDFADVGVFFEAWEAGGC
ncbi:MAG: hypothetical protein NTV94_08160, partial [Planctomycetota bacterium]|nr:hypothetical protein [Planctomycetota bacterium]